VDIVWRAPDGRCRRERKRLTVDSRSTARRWGEARERELLVNGPAMRKEVPTFSVFWPRFLDGYARANRQKPSGIAAKETIGRVHLQPHFGAKRLDAITTEQVQHLKHALTDCAPKTVNNVRAADPTAPQRSRLSLATQPSRPGPHRHSLTLANSRFVERRGYRAVGISGLVDHDVTDRQVATPPRGDQLDIDHGSQLRSAGRARIRTTSLGVDSSVLGTRDQPDTAHCLNVELHLGVCAAVGISGHHGDAMNRAGHENTFIRTTVEQNRIGRNGNKRVRHDCGTRQRCSTGC
jgi:hypothetical protein